jgi:RNase P subunit RPR2
MTAITCAKCYRRFTPTADAIQAALEAHQGQRHALLLCPHCGKANKVSVERLRDALRFAPKTRPAAEAEAGPAADASPAASPAPTEP